MNSEHFSLTKGTIPEDAAARIVSLRTLAESHSLALCVQGLDGQLLECNAQYTRLTGQLPELVVNPGLVVNNEQLKNNGHLADSSDTAEHQSRNVALVGRSAEPQNLSDSGLLSDALRPAPLPIDHPCLEIPVTDQSGSIIALATLTGNHDVAELKNALQARDTQLSALQSLMTDLLDDKDLNTLLQSMADILISHTDATQTLILLVNEADEHLTVIAGSGPLAEKNMGETRQRGVGFEGMAWATGETQYITDSDQNKQTRGFWPADTQLAAVPLKLADSVIGVTVIGALSQSAGLSESIAVIDTLSNLTSYAIDAADRVKKAKKNLQNSRGISEISQLMTSLDDTDQLLDSVSRTLVESFDFTWCTFYQPGEEHELHSDKTWTKTGNEIEPLASLAPDVIEESSCFWSYIHKETVCIPRKTEDPRESERVRLIRTDLGMGCTVTIPVLVNGDVFAVLMVCKDIHQSACNENELNLLSSIVQQLSAAIYGINATNALRYQAYHDTLTKLPNRSQFEKSLHRILKARKTDSSKGALLFLNLDGFKIINDTLGHVAGDTVLQLVAKRLHRCVMNTDIISRVGGKEFSVILPSITTAQDALRTAQCIRESILNPFVIGKSVANVGTHIGLCFFPTHGDTVDVLCRNADVALNQAKTSGKNNIVYFEEHMAQAARKKLLIETDLHDALDQNQFLLHYQPQVDPVKERVVGVEALVRWQHPQHGLVSPTEFIPIAEETGLINDIGTWVLQEAISQLAAWKATPLSHLKVSVNIAAPQFIFGDISSHISDQLKKFDVSPKMLEVELTESVVMKDIDQVALQLKALQNLGVTVALDDFGTGYSSLSYLQDLPLDVLKIDRAFVVRLTDEKSDYSLVNTIMLLASGLGLQTVAEGVETKYQLDRVTELQCTLIQGFYYSQPCTVEELSDVVGRIDDQFNSCKAA